MYTADIVSQRIKKDIYPLTLCEETDFPNYRLNAVHAHPRRTWISPIHDRMTNISPLQKSLLNNNIQKKNLEQAGSKEHKRHNLNNKHSSHNGFSKTSCTSTGCNAVLNGSTPDQSVPKPVWANAIDKIVSALSTSHIATEDWVRIENDSIFYGNLCKKSGRVSMEHAWKTTAAAAEKRCDVALCEAVCMLEEKWSKTPTATGWELQHRQVH